MFIQNAHLAQLGDFGVAHIADQKGVVPAHGGYHIRAPERWTTGNGTARSDVFSVGVTLYYLLSGRYPADGTAAEIAQAITTGAYEDVRNVAPHVPLALAQRVRKAMALDPADRFASAEEMHTSLGQLVPMRREWKRVTTHGGHVECWEGIGVGGSPSLRTCVIPTATGDGFSIETRRMITA